MKERVIILGLLLLGLFGVFVATTTHHAQSKHPSPRDPGEIDFYKAYGLGWSTHFEGDVFRRAKDDQVGYRFRATDDDENHLSLWPKSAKIEVSSGKNYKSAKHTPIHLEGFEIACWTYVLAKGKHRGAELPLGIVVGYQKITRGEDFLYRRECKVVLYADVDEDGVIENDESHKELALPKGHFPYSMAMREGRLYLRLQPMWGFDAKHVVATYLDKDEDELPESLDTKPLREVQPREGKWYGYKPFEQRPGFLRGPERPKTHSVETKKREALIKLLFPMASPNSNNLVEFLYQPLDQDDFVYLKGPANSPFVVADRARETLAEGKLDAKGRAKVQLPRALVYGEIISTSVIPKGPARSANAAYAKLPIPMVDKAIPLSVNGEKKLVIRGRNLKSATMATFRWKESKSWLCEIDTKSDQEIWITTPDLSEEVYENGSARIRLHGSWEKNWRSTEIPLRLIQSTTPHVASVRFRGTLGKHSFSIGKAETLTILGRNLNKHTRAELIFKNLSMALPLKFDAQGTSAKVEIPRMLGKVQQGAEGYLVVYGAAQKRSEGQQFALSAEKVTKKLGIRSVEGDLLPTRGVLTVKGKFIPHSAQIYYRDKSGEEHHVGVNVGESTNYYRTYQITMPVRECFPPNTNIELTIRDAAASEGGETFKVAVGEFRPTKVRWVSPLKLNADGTINLRLRADDEMNLDGRRVVVEHAGKSIDVNFIVRPKRRVYAYYPLLADLYDDPLLLKTYERDALIPKIEGLKKGDKVTLWIRHQYQTKGGQKFEGKIE